MNFEEAIHEVLGQKYGREHRTPRGTEHEAAKDIAEHAPRLRQRVLELLRAHPEGLTDDEGGELLNGDRLTFGRRRQELCTAGLVVDAGLRRETPHGRSAIVWRAQ